MSQLFISSKYDLSNPRSTIKLVTPLINLIGFLLFCSSEFIQRVCVFHGVSPILLFHMIVTSTCFIVITILVSNINSQENDDEQNNEIKFNAIANELALNLFNVMTGKSVIASTLMVRLPLIKLASAAGGETKAELMTALGYKSFEGMLGAYTRLRERLAAFSSSQMVYSNKMYVNFSNYVNHDFFANSEYEYGVKVESVSFNYPVAVVSHINKWMLSSTLKRIPAVIDVNDIDKNTKMVIVSGIHFRVTWETPLNIARTRLETFNYINGSTTQVPMMLKVDFIDYADTGEYQAIKLNLELGGHMILVLPYGNQALPELIERIQENPKHLSAFVNRMKYDKILTVKIPKFQIKSYVDWTGFIQDLGVQSVFNCSTSDLSGMLKPNFRWNDRMCLNKLKQRIFIEVDEMGVYRHVLEDHEGGMGEEMAEALRPGEHMEVIFDRPFLFTINIQFSEAHNHELLTGVYYGP